jgi:hypothetical protein
MRISLLVAIVLLSVPAFAWNKKGHMVVAYIAYRNLTPAAKTRVDDLLRKNADYSKWIARAKTEEAKALHAFLNSSAWADDIKGYSDYQDHGTQGGNVPPPNDPAASQNIGYSDKLRHKYWHFHDTPLSGDGTPVKPADPPSAKTQMPVLRDAMRNGASDDIKSYDLVWMIHLVGDVHQPLHAVGRFTARQPDGDAGGNLVTLSTSGVVRLHTYWDNLLGERDDAEDAIALGEHLMTEFSKPSGADEDSIDKWIDDSFKLARKNTYASPIRKDGESSVTSRKYRMKAREIAEKQVLLAGYRLSRLINQSFQ